MSIVISSVNNNNVNKNYNNVTIKNWVAIIIKSRTMIIIIMNNDDNNDNIHNHNDNNYYHKLLLQVMFFFKACLNLFILNVFF